MIPGGADVHAGALADGLQALEDGYVLCVIAGVASHRGVVGAPLCGRLRLRA